MSGDFREGLCNADGECVRFPIERSAGTISVLVNARPALDVFFFPRTGYNGGIGIPDDLFAAGDRLLLRAVGGPDVPSFSLAGRMPEPISMDLDYVPFDTSRTMLQMVDGQDLVLRWSPVVPESRVRLEILSSSPGHGQPRRAIIECESHDSGELVVPRAMVEAFPMFPARSGCPGFDCPEGRLTRYVIDRSQIDGREIELLVGAEREFEPVHGDPGTGEL